jgi:hypothetical protein
VTISPPSSSLSLPVPPISDPPAPPTPPSMPLLPPPAASKYLSGNLSTNDLTSDLPFPPSGRAAPAYVLTTSTAFLIVSTTSSLMRERVWSALVDTGRSCEEEEAEEFVCAERVRIKERR